MTKEFKKVEYINQEFSEYSKDREVIINDGWKVEDISFFQKILKINCQMIGNYVTGTVMYSKSGINT